MEGLNWDYDGQQYLLKTVHGKAVIVEVPDERKSKIIGAANNKYLVRLELEDGSIREPARFSTFNDFGAAEAYLMYRELASLVSQAQLTETLNYCVQLLSAANADSTHFQRLQLVAQTLNLPELTVNSRPSENVSKRTQTTTFTWQEDGDTYLAETHHGIAKITHVKAAKTLYGGAGTYYPSLVDASVAIKRGWGYATFEAAEEWLITKLEELDNPTGNKADVDNVLYTLDICIKLLPDDSEPMHYIRLRTMQDEFSQIVL